MSNLLALTALAAVLPTAAASEREKNAVQLVIGSYASNDDAFGLYSPNNVIASPGFRAERDLRGPVSLVGTYTRKRVASEYFDSLVESDQADVEREDAAMVAAFTAQQLTFGPKVRLDLGRALSPYLVGQGLVFIGTSRLDDDPTREGNLNELKARSWAPGFVAAGGMEFSPRVGPVHFSSFLEMGYNWTAQMNFTDENIREHGTNEPADMGDMAFRGFYVQLGLGVRF